MDRQQIDFDEAINTAVKRVAHEMKRRRTTIVDIVIGVFVGMWLYHLSYEFVLMLIEAMFRSGVLSSS